MRSIPLALTAASLLTATPAARAGRIELPPPEGPHAVGYWAQPLKTSRNDDLAAERDAKRKLLLELFYPARATSREVKPYATPFIAAALEAGFPLPKGFAAEVLTHAVPGAPADDGTFPVLVFSHGLSWPPTLYQSLTEELASRGYVVVAVSHPHGAPIDYGAGKSLGTDAWPQIEDEAARDAMLARRAGDWTADLRDALTAIETWKGESPEGNPVSGHLDLHRIAAAGHSLGGTAVGRLTADPRLKAVTLMEGLVRNDDQSPVTVRVPLLHLVGGYNRMEFEGGSYLPSHDAPVYQVVIEGTGHAYFSDLIYLYRHHADADWKQRHRYETDPGRVLQITRDYLVAFFGRYLQGTDSGVLLRPVGLKDRLAGPRTAGYPEVDLSIAVE